MSNADLFKNAIYKHYKGNLYRVIDLVRHSETLEELVLYEALYENNLGNLWVRPKEMFTGNVDIGGNLVPRFKLEENQPSVSEKK